MNHKILIDEITPSQADYLKVMLKLSGETGVHAGNVAQALGITKAGVSRMMKRLQAEGYVHKEKYSVITLTEKGLQKAIHITWRYNLLKLLFVEILGIDTETAARDACQVEHVISLESINKVYEHLNRQAKL